MKKLTALLGLSIILSSATGVAQGAEDDIRAMREQIEALTQRLDRLERENSEMRARQELQGQSVAGADTKIQMLAAV